MALGLLKGRARPRGVMMRFHPWLVTKSWSLHVGEQKQ